MNSWNLRRQLHSFPALLQNSFPNSLVIEETFLKSYPELSTPRAKVRLPIILLLAPKYYLPAVCQRFEEPKVFLILYNQLSFN